MAAPLKDALNPPISPRVRTDGAELTHHMCNASKVNELGTASSPPAASELPGSPEPEQVREAAKMARRAAALLLAVALAAVVLSSSAAAAAQKKPATAARREDIPYIQCQVCERIAREISAQVAKKQQALPPSKKVLASSNLCSKFEQFVGCV